MNYFLTYWLLGMVWAWWDMERLKTDGGDKYDDLKDRIGLIESVLGPVTFILIVAIGGLYIIPAKLWGMIVGDDK